MIVIAGAGMIPLAAWSIILKDWFLVVVCVYGMGDGIITAPRWYAAGWPGSRLDSHRGLMSLRISNAQWLLTGLVFVTATLPLLLIQHDEHWQVIAAATGLISVVCVFRFVRAMRKEGWQGKEHGTR